MKTYLIVWFNADGAVPSAVTQRLMSLGFKPTTGNYDYVYEWPRNSSVDEILAMGDKIALTLKGTKASFKLETI